MAKKLEVKVVQGKGKNSSGKVTTGKVQRPKRQTLVQARNEGYNDALRTCVELLISDGLTRDYIADIFAYGIVSMGFPSTDNPNWWSSWAYENWDDWVAAEESECEA